MAINLTPDVKFKISVGVAVTTVIAAVGFGWKAQATLSAINESVKQAKDEAAQGIAETNRKMSNMENTLVTRMISFESVIADRWTKTMQSDWAARFKIANPGIPVPDPKEPGRLLGEARVAGDSQSYANIPFR